MVNAQNLRQPAPFLDTAQLVKLGLVDDPFAQPNNFNFGGLGFQQGQPEPQQVVQPISPQDDGLGGLRESLKQIESQRTQIPGQINAAYEKKAKLELPKTKRPRGLNDSQAGLGALAALLLRLGGASHESVTGAYGQYVGGVMQRNKEEADDFNAKELAAYKASMDAINEDIERMKTVEPMLGRQYDDIKVQMNGLMNEKADILKARAQDGEEAANELHKLRIAGTLIPSSLAHYSNIVNKNGGSFYDPAIESYADWKADAEANERRLGKKRALEVDNAAELLAGRIKTNELRDIDISRKALMFKLEHSTHQSKIDRAIDLALIADHNRQQEEIETANLPEKTRLGLQKARQQITAAAQSMIRTQQLIDNYGSASETEKRKSKGPMVAGVRGVITEMSNAMEKIRGYIDDEQGQRYSKEQVNNLYVQAREFARQIAQIDDDATRKQLIKELKQRVALPAPIAQDIDNAESERGKLNQQIRHPG